jgi:hypothetical protein
MHFNGVRFLYKDKNISDEEFITVAVALNKEVAKNSDFMDSLLGWSKAQLEGINIWITVFLLTSLDLHW